MIIKIYFFFSLTVYLIQTAKNYVDFILCSYDIFFFKQITKFLNSYELPIISVLNNKNRCCKKKNKYYDLKTKNVISIFLIGFL